MSFTASALIYRSRNSGLLFVSILYLLQRRMHILISFLFFFFKYSKFASGRILQQNPFFFYFPLTLTLNQRTYIIDSFSFEKYLYLYRTRPDQRIIIFLFTIIMFNGPSPFTSSPYSLTHPLLHTLEALLRLYTLFGQ
jgi:hypothetical protein